MKLVVAFLLGMMTMVAIQGKTADWLVGSGIALHLNGKTYCNEITAGLGVERVDGDWRYSAGFYDNSNCRWSVYAGMAWTPFRIFGAAVGALGGGVTGYKNDLTPVGAGFAAFEGRRWGLDLTYI